MAREMTGKCGWTRQDVSQGRDGEAARDDDGTCDDDEGGDKAGARSPQSLRVKTIAQTSSQPGWTRPDVSKRLAEDARDDIPAPDDNADVDRCDAQDGGKVHFDGFKSRPRRKRCQDGGRGARARRRGRRARMSFMAGGTGALRVRSWLRCPKCRASRPRWRQDRRKTRRCRGAAADWWQSKMKVKRRTRCAVRTESASNDQ